MHAIFPAPARRGYDPHTRAPNVLRMPTTPVLDADGAALLQLGCSINAGAVGPDGMPTSVRCCGCRVASDRSCITVFMSRVQGAPLLQALAANGAIAVVFSQPTTHRTLQIKGRDAAVLPLEAGDARRIAEYRTALARELSAFGYDEILAYTILSHPASEVVAVRFTPTEVYQQTPGPKAGERIA